jgi:hypothetical protein
MAVNKNTDTCNCCRFFSNNQEIMGSCKRYPTYQNRHGSDWCGEYSPDQPTQVVNLIVEHFVEPTEQPKKKRGRPFKK